MAESNLGNLIKLWKQYVASYNMSSVVLMCSLSEALGYIIRYISI